MNGGRIRSNPSRRTMSQSSLNLLGGFFLLSDFGFPFLTLGSSLVFERSLKEGRLYWGLLRKKNERKIERKN